MQRTFRIMPPGAALIILLTASLVEAADITWNVLDGDYLDGENWTGGIVPADPDNAVISNGGTATFSADVVTASQLWVGQNGFGTETGTMVQNGGDVSS